MQILKIVVRRIVTKAKILLKIFFCSGLLKAILIDKCNNGFVTNIERTTKILRDSRVSKPMQGCSFTLCARVAEPHVEIGCHDGLEIQIMKTLQDIMQFDVSRFTISYILENYCSYNFLFAYIYLLPVVFQLKIICMQTPRGEKNGNWTHLLGMLKNGVCDIVAGGFFPDNEVHTEFGFTTPYLQETYTW